jgi:hypothetical protein
MGSVMSTKEEFSSVHMSAYSFPVVGSVQPQESLPLIAPSVNKSILLSKSYPLQGYTPAKPSSQSVIPGKISSLEGGGETDTGGSLSGEHATNAMVMAIVIMYGIKFFTGFGFNVLLNKLVLFYN